MLRNIDNNYHVMKEEIIMSTPFIALSASFLHKESKPGAPASLRTVNIAYCDALTKAASVPVITAGAPAEYYAQKCDGLLLTGGCDAQPELYGEAALNDTVETDLVRDAEEMALFQAFYNLGKPIFGICRGIQLINVAMGGSLWQDIPSQCPGGIMHSGGTVHEISIEPENALSELFGTHAAVNSYHHQSIKALAPGLRAIAHAPDGIIEAVCHENYPMLAVQWHPERMLALRPGELDDMAAFFEYITHICLESIG